MTQQEKRYYQFSRYLREQYGVKVYKITLDAGFTCPNRDGTLSYAGCTFCDESGSFSQAHSSALSIQEQLLVGIESLKRRFNAEKFIAYFQAHSNTYKPLEDLKKIYDEGTNHPDIVGISIGTRPDCIDEAKLALIQTYLEKYSVGIEYGLQSANDKTLLAINRGHTYADFENAFKLTKSAGIRVCVHVILGLPGETKKDMLFTAQKLADLGVDEVKFHMLCALKGTPITKMYEEGKLQLLSQEEYIDTVCDFLEILPPSTVIHRLAKSGLDANLIAPKWIVNKFEVMNSIDRELEKRNSYQGSKN